MATNILSLPFVTISFVNGTNEDWIDSLLYLIPDGSGNIDQYPQMDLRGIDFEMELRRTASDHEVILHASTTDGTIQIGAYPNFGWFIIDLPVDDIEPRQAGDYVGDVVARDGTFTRRCMYINLSLAEGITRSDPDAEAASVAATMSSTDNVATLKIIQGVRR